MGKEATTQINEKEIFISEIGNQVYEVMQRDDLSTIEKRVLYEIIQISELDFFGECWQSDEQISNLTENDTGIRYSTPEISDAIANLISIEDIREYHKDMEYIRKHYKGYNGHPNGRILVPRTANYYVSPEYIKDVKERKDLKVSEKDILCLFKHILKKDESIACKSQTIDKILGYRPQTVSNAINKLVELGEIEFVSSDTKDKKVKLTTKENRNG